MGDYTRKMHGIAYKLKDFFIPIIFLLPQKEV